MLFSLACVPGFGLEAFGEDMIAIRDHILGAWTVRREPDVLPEVREKPAELDRAFRIERGSYLL